MKYLICSVTLLGPLVLHSLGQPRQETPAPQLPMAMFGGSPARNMVNLEEKNVTTDWNVGENKNIKWAVRAGSRSYGGPIVSGGKIFIGTNNESPRDKRHRTIKSPTMSTIVKVGDTPVRNAKDLQDIVAMLPLDMKTVQGTVLRDEVAVPEELRISPIDLGVLMCFRESDGEFLWQAVHEKLPSGRVVDWPREGLCSTPTVEGNYLYYVSNRCEVICATTSGLGAGKNEGVQDEKYQGKTDADIVWRFDMIRELNVFPHNMSSCCPLIVGDILYVITSNGVDDSHLNLPSPEAPSFIALDKKTGRLIWRNNTPGKNIMHGQWSNPTYVQSKRGQQVIFPGGDGWLYSLEPARGKHLWRFDANPKDSKYELGRRGTRSDFIATPTFYKGKIYIGVGQDPEHNEGVGHLWCIDPDKNAGDVSPELVVDAKVFPPKTKPNPHSAVVWHFGGPTTAADKKKLNRSYYFGRTMSTCAVHDGLVYACDLGGYFCCLDAGTGKLYWSHELGAQVWASPYWVDGKIYIGDDDGVVHIFAHGKEKKLIAQHDLDTKIRSNPVVANGVLYVLTSINLYAIAGR